MMLSLVTALALLGAVPAASATEAVPPGPLVTAPDAPEASDVERAVTPRLRPSHLDYLADLRRRLDRAARARRVVGLAVAVLERGEPVFVYTAGETAAGSGEPITVDTIFRAGSVTKTFTGTLAAMLETEGRLDLDEAVPQTLIQLKGQRAPTWRELLSHQTGLPPNAYDNLIEAGRGVEDVRERLADVDLICPLAECYTYQNVAFAAVEAVIEQATGQSYEEAVRERLLTPFGLEAAGFGADHLRAAQSWARPHRGWRRSRDRAGDPESDYDRLASAAALALSLNDMIAWAQAHLHEGFGVPSEARRAAWTREIASRRETIGLRRLRRVDDTAYGLGWRIYDWGGRTLIAHGGALSGYGAHILIEPETDFAVVALWNADARAPWRIWPTVMDLRTGGPGEFIDEAIRRDR